MTTLAKLMLSALAVLALVACVSRIDREESPGVVIGQQATHTPVAVYEIEGEPAMPAAGHAFVAPVVCRLRVPIYLLPSHTYSEYPSNGAREIAQQCRD